MRRVRISTFFIVTKCISTKWMKITAKIFLRQTVVKTRKGRGHGHVLALLTLKMSPGASLVKWRERVFISWGHILTKDKKGNVYNMWRGPFAVQHKLAQHAKSIILQLYFINLKKNVINAFRMIIFLIYLVKFVKNYIF